MSDTVNWKTLETEYITTTISQRALAEKYSIPLRTITYQSRKGSWVEKRQQHCDKVAAKAQKKIEEKQATTQANRLLRLTEINDRLLDQVDEATKQLNRHPVSIKKTVTRRTKNTETKTITNSFQYLEGDVDRAELRHVTAAMKNIADVYLKERAARKEDDDASGIAITISGVTQEDAEEFSK